MDLITRKNNFKERFDQIKDIDLVERFEEFLEMHLSNKKIVAYTIQGNPLTKEMYIEKVNKTLLSVRKGNFTTIENLEKESENW